MVEVTTTVERAGHTVTVGAQLVMVTWVVVKTVMVVKSSYVDDSLASLRVAAAVVVGISVVETAAVVDMPALGRAATTAAKAARANAYCILILVWGVVELIWADG